MSQFLYLCGNTRIIVMPDDYQIKSVNATATKYKLRGLISCDECEWFELYGGDGSSFEEMFDEYFVSAESVDCRGRTLIELIEALSKNFIAIIFVYSEIDDELKITHSFAEFDNMVKGMLNEDPIEISIGWNRKCY